MKGIKSEQVVDGFLNRWLMVLVGAFISLMACVSPERLHERGSATITSPSTQEHRLEIIKAMLVAKGRLIEIRYRIVGGEVTVGDPKAKALNPKETYIVDELTGEVIFVENPPRLMVYPRQIPPSYIVVPTSGRIKKGSLITVVIGGLRQEHVKVEEEVIY